MTDYCPECELRKQLYSAEATISHLREALIMILEHSYPEGMQRIFAAAALASIPKEQK